MKKPHLPRCSWTAASLVKQHKSSSSRRAQTSKPPSIEVLAGILLTSAGMPHSLNVGEEGMLRPQQLPCSLCTSPLAARACGGLLYSSLNNFNYKPQVKSRQQHVALNMDRHLRSVAIMTEVINRHTEYTHFNSDCCQLPAFALHQTRAIVLTCGPHRGHGS